MLKVKRRKDVKNDNYYIFGTFYYEDETIYVETSALKQTNTRMLVSSQTFMRKN